MSDSEAASSGSLFIELLAPIELYNILNQSLEYPYLSDPDYLLLIDARKLHEYNESHILTARKAPTNTHNQYTVPFDAQLECKQTIVVYDGTTDSLHGIETSDALKCAKLLADRGSRNPVKVLCGGYEQFSALYPFLRTQKILWLPQEKDDIQTYPLELLPGQVYIGNRQQGNDDNVKKDLKIKAKISCCVEEDCTEIEGANFMKIPITDDNDVDLKKHLSAVCTFIGSHIEKKTPVLIYSDLGYSRCAAIAIAYIMHSKKQNLQESYGLVRNCCVNACPNASFLGQLDEWFKETIGVVSAAEA